MCFLFLHYDNKLNCFELWQNCYFYERKTIFFSSSTSLNVHIHRNEENVLFFLRQTQRCRRWQEHSYMSGVWIILSLSLSFLPKWSIQRHRRCFFLSYRNLFHQFIIKNGQFTHKCSTARIKRCFRCIRYR
jgi:hypothetical protein